jgi:hypothetical protein
MRLPNIPMDEFAPAKIDNSTPHNWYNTYGGYIIETRWNPTKKSYEEIFHSYNMPNLNLMPTQ